MATVSVEIEDHILHKAVHRLTRDGADLQMLLRNRLVEMAYATPLWRFTEEPYNEDQIEQLGHISVRDMMYR